MKAYRVAFGLALGMGLAACEKSSSPQDDASSQTPVVETVASTGGETASENLSANPSLPASKTNSDTTAPQDQAAEGSPQAAESEETVEQVSEADPETDEAETPTEGLAIKGILAEGDGCPADSVVSQISEDSKAFTISFGAFAAEILPGQQRSRKDCRLTLKVEVPSGWQYSIASFNHRGYLSIDEGIRATHLTRYYFHRFGRGGGFRHDEIGALTKDFVYTDSLNVISSHISHQWSPCSHSVDLHIDSSVILKNVDLESYPDATGMIAKDTLDGEFVQKFGLSWRRCQEP